MLDDHTIFHAQQCSGPVTVLHPQHSSCMRNTQISHPVKRPWPSSTAVLLSGPPPLHLLQAWRIYQRGLERWLADLLQPVFDSLITDHTGRGQLQHCWVHPAGKALCVHEVAQGANTLQASALPVSMALCSSAMPQLKQQL